MNKKIKRIIAMTLVLGAFSSVAPNKNFNLLTTKAYASSNGDQDYGIDNLEVIKGDSSSEDENEDDLNLYTNSDYSNSTSFDRSEYKYYVKTSGNSIRMRVSKVNGCTYKIFNGNSSDAHSSGDKLDLKSGDNVFYIRTYDSGDFNPKNIEEKQIRCYEIHVEKKGTSSINLESISLSDGNIDFSNSKSSYNVEVESSVGEITITAKPNDTDYTVKIADTKVDDKDHFRKKISLNKGKNTIKINVGDDADNSKTYTLNIYRGTTAVSSKATVEYGPNDYSQPSAYLSDLKLNSGDINLEFKKNVSVYNVKIDSAVDEMYVAATPEESDSKVDINEKILTSDKEYEASLKNLTTGQNTFIIKVKDADGNSRKYTLNIYRGVNIPSANTAITADSNTKVIAIQDTANKWAQASGKWQYNGSDGKPMKNQLFYDDNYKKTYFLNAEGFLSTGWQTLNGKSYYADGSGAIQKGWLKLEPNWYHLDATTGVMDTGWIKDADKDYYLDSSGIMAHDKYIGEYKLGSDGAWIQ